MGSEVSSTNQVEPHILKTRSPNFDKDKIIYIFEEDKKLMDEPNPHIDKYYRVVLIQKLN